MGRVYVRALLRIRVTQNPVTTVGALLTETSALLYELTDHKQDQLVTMIKQTLRNNDVHWFHLEDNVTEAHVGAQGIGSEIVVWVTTNAHAIAAGILSNILSTALQASLDVLNVKVAKTESVNHMKRAVQHQIALQQLTREENLHLETISAPRRSVVYLFAANSCKYEIEEQSGNISVKRLIV